MPRSGHAEGMELSKAFALGLVAVAAVGCRPALSPTQTPEAVDVSPGPGVTACWVESRARFGFTASALVVRHPDGDLLVDAGNSTNFTEEIQPYHGKQKRWLAVFPGSLKPHRPLADELQDVGVAPDTLRWVVPTHAHLDHLGGVLDLPPTPVLMDDAEAEVVEHGQHRATFGVIPAHARAVAAHVEALPMVEEPYEVFDRHADLFGDGSVVVVPLPGHTPGSVGVFVRLTDGRRVFHLGDAVNDRTQVDALRGKTPAMRDTDADRAQAERTVARLHSLHDQRPNLLMVPAHERDAWRDAFGKPAERCPAPT